MISTARFLPLALAVCLLSLSASLRAASETLLRETFDSGVSSAWRTVNAVPTLVHEASSPPSGLDGNGLRHRRTNRIGTDGLHCVNFAPTTLAPGDSLTLSFDLRGVSYARNQGNHLVFGFLQGVGVSPASPEGATGYAATLRMDGRDGVRGRLHTFRALDLSGVSPGELGTLGDEKGETRRGGLPFHLNDNNLSDRFRFSLTVTRLPEGDLRLDAAFLNHSRQRSFGVVRAITLADSQRAGGDAAYTFDGIAIGFRRAGSEDSVFDLDNIEVTRAPRR